MPTTKPSKKCGSSFGSILAYCAQERKGKDYPPEKKAELVLANNVVKDYKGAARQMRWVADTKEGTLLKKPVLHFSVNFDSKEKLSEEQRRKAVAAIIERVGIDKDKHQFVVFQHKDTDHAHYHVVLNRVSLDGDIFSDKQIAMRLTAAADKIEQEMGLQRTPNRKVFWSDNERGWEYGSSKKKQAEQQQEPTIKEPRIFKSKDLTLQAAGQYIQNAIQTTLKEGISSPEAFKKAIEQKGIDVRLSGKQKVTGAAFMYDGVKVKGTNIGYKWAQIEARFLGQSKEAQEAKALTAGQIRQEMHYSTFVHAAKTVDDFRSSLEMLPTIKSVMYITNNEGLGFTIIAKDGHTFTNKDFGISINSKSKIQSMNLDTYNQSVKQRNALIIKVNEAVKAQQKAAEIGQKIEPINLDKIYKNAGFDVRKLTDGNVVVRDTSGRRFDQGAQLYKAAAGIQNINNEFQKKREAYSNLMSQRPYTMSFLQRYSAEKRGEITSHNANLAAKQKAAIKPEYQLFMESAPILKDIARLQSAARPIPEVKTQQEVTKIITQEQAKTTGVTVDTGKLSAVKDQAAKIMAERQQQQQQAQQQQKNHTPSRGM